MLTQYVQSFRIVASPPEASLHPRAIWQHWQRCVIWDPRTYYGIIQILGLLVVVFSYLTLAHDKRREISPFARHLAAGLLILVSIAPLHWYSTHRTSSHILTRTRTHIGVLLGLTVILLALIINLLVRSHANCNPPTAKCDVDAFFAGLLSGPMLLCPFTAYILFSTARARLHPLIAELPYAVEDENGVRRPVGDWAEADVAEGIPDDSPEPEGEVRL